MKKSIWWIVGIVVIVVVIIAVSSSKPTETGPIKVGFLGALTGDVASLGIGAQAAVQIATDEINKAGGINGRQIEVTYEDGKCSPSGSANAAQKGQGYSSLT